MAILPIHSFQKGNSPRKVREKVLLVLVFVGFLLICFGAFHFVPDLFEKPRAVEAPSTTLSHVDAGGGHNAVDKPHIEEANGGVVSNVESRKEDTLVNAIDEELEALGKNSAEHHRLFVKKVCFCTIQSVQYITILYAVIK